MRTYSWRRHNHPFTLSFLEEVLRWVGMNEVHKAVTLFLDTLAKLPGSPRTQRSLYREFLFLTLAAMGKDHVGKTSPVCCTDDITSCRHLIIDDLTSCDQFVWMTSLPVIAKNQNQKV